MEACDHPDKDNTDRGKREGVDQILWIYEVRKDFDVNSRGFIRPVMRTPERVAEIPVVKRVGAARKDSPCR